MSFFGKRRPNRPDAFEAQTLEHLDALYAVSCRLTKAPLDAEDLVQDTLVKAMRARDQYEPGTNLKAGSSRSCTTRSSTNIGAAGSNASCSRGPTPILWRTVGDAASCARSATGDAGLRPPRSGRNSTGLWTSSRKNFELAVVLSDVEELSYKEIADVMVCPVGTVMSRLHRGRRLLQSGSNDHAFYLAIAPVNEAPEETGAVDMAAYRARKANDDPPCRTVACLVGPTSTRARAFAAPRSRKAHRDVHHLRERLRAGSRHPDGRSA